MFIHNIPGFMTIWTILCQNGLVMQLIPEHISLILLSKSIVKSGLSCMVELTGLWLRLNNNLPLACPSLKPLLEVAKPDLKQKLLPVNVQKQHVPDSSVGPILKKAHLETD